MSSRADPAGLPVMGVRVAAGVTVAVPPRIDLLTPYVLLEQENWFEDEIVFLCRCLGAGARIVDIGANYGLYSLSLAKAAGPGGRIWSVEPAAQTAAYLERSIADNALANTTLIRTALSNREGTAQLSTEANSELNSIAQGSPGAASEEVPLTTLDALAARNRWDDIDFLKLDAEGEEARILEGGAAFLDAADPLVMFEIKHGEVLNLHLVERLRASGYAPYILVPGLGVLAPFDASDPPDVFSLNLFACKAGRAQRLASEGILARSPVTVLSADSLTHYRAAHASGNDAALRVAHLRAAHTAMEARCAPGGGARDLATGARIARELGLRQRSVELLNEALKISLQGGGGPPSAAALAPVAAFDRVDPGGREREWLDAALLDGLVEQSTFSTYFTAGTPQQQVALARLDALKATGFMRAPMERRRQLLRILARMQASPAPDPILSAYGEDNLNPGLWGAGATGK